MAESDRPRLRYGIAEWYGEPIRSLSADTVASFANIALQKESVPPQCPFQHGAPVCSKKGGVCSIQLYEEGANGRLGNAIATPVITCPKRFEEQAMVVNWLGEIVGFEPVDIQLAREVPFMESISTAKAAGKIDLVVAKSVGQALSWYGLEIQAVYFSGEGMGSEFEAILGSPESLPFPAKIRRPDWRSSSAKRLMPQLQIKVPTLRRWGSKMAVALDRPFFDALGGPSEQYSTELGDGDIIWIIPEIALHSNGSFALSRGHWEVLTLEASVDKLLAAKTVAQSAFESVLRSKLQALA